MRPFAGLNRLKPFLPAKVVRKEGKHLTKVASVHFSQETRDFPSSSQNSGASPPQHIRPANQSTAWTVLSPAEFQVNSALKNDGR